MPLYTVDATIILQEQVEVEAEDEVEAINLAREGFACMEPTAEHIEVHNPVEVEDDQSA